MSSLVFLNARRLLCVTLLVAAPPAIVASQPHFEPLRAAGDSVETQQRSSATVPLYVEHNRPFVDLDFARPDGSTRKARFWVDTGGGGFIIVETLARELNLKLGPSISEGGEQFAQTEVAGVSIGGIALDLDPKRTSIAVGRRMMMPGVPAEGLLPGHVLMKYHVVFDYPNHTFTIARPGSLKPRGLALPSPINRRSGFPRIEAKIGERTYGFLLDTGASFTMISQELLTQWGAEHPDWPRSRGAVGAANMGLGPMEVSGVLMRPAGLEISTFRLQPAAISRPKGTFENYMSQMMTAPIVGAIGGNVFKAFRVEIDYSNGITYLEKKAEPDQNDLDIIAITLRPMSDGTYIVAAVSDQNDQEFKNQVQAGDRLLKVGSLDVAGTSLARVIDSMRGKPGQKRSLILERAGKQFTVSARIVKVL